MVFKNTIKQDTRQRIIYCFNSNLLKKLGNNTVQEVVRKLRECLLQ